MTRNAPVYSDQEPVYFDVDGSDVLLRNETWPDHIGVPRHLIETAHPAVLKVRKGILDFNVANARAIYRVNETGEVWDCTLVYAENPMAGA